DIGRVVLEIDVERQQDRVPRIGEPGGQGRGLAEVPPETHKADATVARRDLLEPLPRAVRRAVIDIDHLVLAPHRFERFSETRVEWLEVVELVEDGEDDGERCRVVSAHWCPSSAGV